MKVKVNTTYDPYCGCSHVQYVVSKVKFDEINTYALNKYLASVRKTEKRRKKAMNNPDPFVRRFAKNMTPDLKLLLQAFGVNQIGYLPNSVKIR